MNDNFKKCKSQNSFKSKSIKNQYLPKVVVQEYLIHHQMVNQVVWVWQEVSMKIVQIHSWQLLVVSNGNSHGVELIRSSGLTQRAKDYIAVKYRIVWKWCSVDSIEEKLSEAWTGEFLANTDINISHLRTLDVHQMNSLIIATKCSFDNSQIHLAIWLKDMNSIVQ